MNVPTYDEALDTLEFRRPDGVLYGSKLDCDRFDKHKRRARKFRKSDAMTTTQWRRTVNYFGGHCAYCHRVSELVAEHMDPLSRRGHHVAINVVPACPKCNHEKRDDDLITWLLRDGRSHG